MNEFGRGLVKNLISPTNILGGAIAIYEDVWDNYKETIQDSEFIASDPNSGVFFFPADVFKGVEKDGVPIQSIRTNYCLELKPASKINDTMIKDQYSDLIQNTIGGYIKTFDIFDKIEDSEGYGLLRYSSGEYYHAHYDGGTDMGRSISAILYLNDDYEGGEIEFVNFDIKIKPKAGTFILFPSNYAYRHIAHPVISGTKYAIVTWLHDR